jgi:acyl-coenzyme A thioesterase PaaI-like protein
MSVASTMIGILLASSLYHRAISLGYFNTHNPQFHNHTMATTYKLNRLATSVRKMESYLPKAWHPVGYSFLFNNMVKLAGTSGLRVEKIGPQESAVYLENRRKVQNHIGGLHACSMALAAESATGLVVGYNVPDSHIPLIKSMNITFVRRCQGAVRATATLSDEDLRRIHQEDHGDVKVQVRVEDESGKEPIQAEMIWAWVSKERKKKT